jgi:hypothetical protein
MAAGQPVGQINWREWNGAAFHADITRAIYFRGSGKLNLDFTWDGGMGSVRLSPDPGVPNRLKGSGVINDSGNRWDITEVICTLNREDGGEVWGILSGILWREVENESDDWSATIFKVQELDDPSADEE